MRKRTREELQQLSVVLADIKQNVAAFGALRNLCPEPDCPACLRLAQRAANFTEAAAQLEAAVLDA